MAKKRRKLRMLSTREAATLLGVRPTSLTRLLREGTIKAYQSSKPHGTWSIPEAEVIAYKRLREGKPKQTQNTRLGIVPRVSADSPEGDRARAAARAAKRISIPGLPIRSAVTLDIRDDLLVESRRLARKTGSSLAEVVEASIEVFISELSEEEEANAETE